VLDVVVVEDTLLAGECDRGLNKLVRAVWEIHHQPIGPAAVVVGDLAHVAGDRGHRVGDTVSPGVLPAVVDRCLVEIDGDNACSAAGGGDRKRADAGKHIEYLFVRFDLFDDAVAFGGESRRKVDRGEIKPERVAVLPVYRFGRREVVAGGRVVDSHYLPVSHPELAFDL